ncbi:MAG TPA: transglycosylase SLT domain-containing protein [Candidatus Nanoarchaeia archaeon]|nr:transglycosylase SLT domain-containing protein [Candidatus Nanoarchaeia archaeon]
MKKNRLIAIFCMLLIVSMPIVFSADVTNNPSPLENQQSSYLSNSFSNSVYNDPYQNYVRRSTGYGSYGPEQYLGEAIVINVADYEPKLVRASLLEQQDVPVFIYLKGYTLQSFISQTGNIISGVEQGTTGTSKGSSISSLSALDPFAISEIPPIDYIQILPNYNTSEKDYIRSINYIKPRKDKQSLSNLGYLVVYLRKIDNENATPSNNTININLNAKIYLNLEQNSLFGVSEQSLSLKQLENKSEFLQNKDKYSFYSGKGYLRATRVSPTSVTLEVYNKDLTPISLASASNAAGLEQRTSVTLAKGETSSPISFGYSGNPINDLFRVRLDEVTAPGDKAEIQYEINGRKITRKVPVNARLHSASNWILKEVKKIESNKVVTQVTNPNVNKVFGSEISVDEVASEFKLKTQQRNELFDLASIGRNLYVEKHQIRIENQVTFEKKVLETKLVTLDGNKPFSQAEVIGPDSVRILERRYCEEVSDVERDDVACQAIFRYQKLIQEFPNSEETLKAKSDLADIYADFLIVYKACQLNVQNRVIDPDSCKIYQKDMIDLAAYYYYQIGDNEKISNLYGTIAGEEYLQDEGVPIKLFGVSTAKDEQPKFKLSLYDGIKETNQITYQNGDVIKSIGINGKIKYEKQGDYYWVVDQVNPSSISLVLRRFTDQFNKEINLDNILDINTYTLLSKLGIKSIPTGERRDLILNRRTTLNTAFAQKDAQGRIIGPAEVANVEVKEIESKSEAYITIVPGAGRAYSTSSFSVHIPVDPRPFKLTPDQLESQIKGTKDLIKILDEIITKLDEYISTLKKLCLGAFAVLTIKNSLSGTRNIARKQVSEYYKASCQKEIAEGKTSEHPAFTRMEECLNHYGDKIKQSTDSTQKHISDINDKIKGKTADELTSVALASSDEEKICGSFNEFVKASPNANQQTLITNYRDCLLNAKIQNDASLAQGFKDYSQQKSNEIGIKTKIQLYNEAVNSAKSSGGKWDPNNQDDIEKIMFQLEQNSVKETKNLNIVKAIKITDRTPGSWEGNALIKDPKDPTQIKPTDLRGLSKIDEFKLSSDDVNELNEKICRSIERAEWRSNQCVLIGKSVPNILIGREQELKEEPSHVPGTVFQQFVSTPYYNALATNSVPKTETDCALMAGAKWETIKLDGPHCQPIIYSVSTYESADRVINTDYSSPTTLNAWYDEEGFPYCYPTGSGEYVLVQKRYPNKLPETIKVMNVGSNGAIECGRGDDVIATGGDTTYLEQNSAKKQTYTSKEPNRCKTDGQTVGKIDSKTVICKKTTQETLNAVTQPQCTDVMDPLDCKILFNFCDPVMCPSSRCTLGGRVPPRNVIQSGLVGSSLLCTPNIQEGIVVPFCLTGISAGLKSIRSILEGYSSCLEINLKQGKNVGFCDYIRSVGICEVVYREAYNLFDISGGVLDWVVNKVSAEPQGGGEYLTFQSSLQNVGESVNVFTNEYKTTYTAQFLSQSSEEIGSQICRASVAGQLPSLGNILDRLTEPEDPPQFSAFFDEVPYASPGETPLLTGSTGASIPLGTQELSLYKAFYHIYAGKGYLQNPSNPQSVFSPGSELTTTQPVVYSVYLVNKERGYQPLYVTFPERGATASIQQGRSSFAFSYQGRIEPGRFSQETVQKIAQKGYNQICVNINGVEQCGFGRVSTSFGLNELKDFITEEESTKAIESADECTPNSQGSKGYSAARLGALAGTQIAAGSGLDLFSQQSGVGTGIVTSEIVETNLYSKGIVRVCSVGEPTPDKDRWREVGTCGSDEQGKTRGSCWLDINSVRVQDVKINSDIQQELTKRTEENILPINLELSKTSLLSLNEQRNRLLETIRTIVQKAKQLGIAPIVGELELPDIPLDVRPAEEDIDIEPADPNAVAKQIIDNYKDDLNKVTNNNKAESEWLAAIMYTESKGNPNAGSPTGCQGLMQICGGSGKGIEVTQNIPDSCKLSDDKCYVCLASSASSHPCSKIDNRKNPYVSIYGGYEIYKQKKRAIESCTKGLSISDSDKIKMYLAAYNGGEGTICKAIKNTGKSTVTWDDVSAQINAELVRGISGYKPGQTYSSDHYVNLKIKEIKNYPIKVFERKAMFVDQM